MTLSARTFLTIWLILAALLGGYFGYDRWLKRELPPGLFQANGRIGGDPIPLPAGLPGKILSFTVKEGDWVEKGQVLGALDESSIKAQLEEAQLEHEKLAATRELLSSELELKKKDVPISIQIAEAAVQKAQAGLEQTQLVEKQRDVELARARESKKKGPQTQKLIEAAELASVAAKTERQTLEAEINRLTEAVNMAKLGFDKIKTAEEELTVLSAQVDEADRKIASVKELMGDPSIKAPISGYITKRLMEVGDLAQVGQATAEMADPTRLFLKVSVPQDRLARMAVGTPARIWLEVRPERMLTGKIGAIAQDPDPAPPAENTGNQTNPAPKADPKAPAPQPTFAVKVYLDANPDGVAKPGQTGVGVLKYDEAQSWRNPRRPFKK